jgi:hypothetical protein
VPGLLGQSPMPDSPAFSAAIAPKIFPTAHSAVETGETGKNIGGTQKMVARAASTSSLALLARLERLTKVPPFSLIALGAWAKTGFSQRQ